MQWNNDECIKILRSQLTNEEIAGHFGVPESRVRAARYYYTGHAIPFDPESMRMPERYSDTEKEARIINLCKKLGVRLGGVR